MNACRKRQMNAVSARVSSLTVAEAAIRRKGAETGIPEGEFRGSGTDASRIFAAKAAPRCAHYTDKA